MGGGVAVGNGVGVGRGVAVGVGLGVGTSVAVGAGSGVSNGTGVLVAGSVEIWSSVGTGLSTQAAGAGVFGIAAGSAARSVAAGDLVAVSGGDTAGFGGDVNAGLAPPCGWVVGIAVVFSGVETSARCVEPSRP